MRRAGFTLIELSVVLVLVALTAATVTLKLAGRRRAATWLDAVDQLQAFEAASRQLARRRGRPCLVTVDVAAGRLERSGTADAAEDWGAGYALPRPFRLAALETAEGCSDRGRVGLVYGVGGTSPSFAWALTDGRTTRWYFVAGLSGQWTELTDGRQAHAILEALGERADAR